MPNAEGRTMIASQAHTDDPLDVLHHFLLWHDASAERDAAREAFTQLRDALAARTREVEELRAALEAARFEAIPGGILDAVRAVEAWNGGDTGRHVVQCADGRWLAGHYPVEDAGEVVAAGPCGLISLGRALAAQEGTR